MRRIIAFVAAVVLAGLGTFLLVRYVQGAEDRALEGVETVEVLVIDRPITAGQRLDENPQLLTLEEVPRKAQAEGSFSERADLEGLVAAVPLVPGEQLIQGRVMTEEDYQALQTDEVQVVVPADLLEITLSLNPERVVGGELVPGEMIAVFASFEPFQLGTIEPTGLDEEIPVIVTTTTVPGQESGEPTTGAQTPNATKIILHQVLVTNVQIEQLPQTFEEGEEPPEGTPDLAPTGNLLISMALEPRDAERLVFTAEFGTIWLAREGADVDTSDTEILTRATVYEPE
jgi:pilus assembly protein CpaB